MQNRRGARRGPGRRADGRALGLGPLLVGIVVVVLLAATVLAQLFLPSYAQRALYRGIQNSLDDYDALDVRLTATPAVELLTGTADTIGIEAHGLRSGNMRIDALSIDGNDVNIDVWELVAEGRLTVEAASYLDATITITEEDLNRYYWAEVDPNRALSVSMERDSVGLEGTVHILGQAVHIFVSGHFEVRGPTSVAFLPDGFSIQDAQIPNFLVNALLEEWELVLNLEDLPVNLAIDGIRIEDGRAVLHAVWAG